MVISTDAEKAFERTQHPFIVKLLKKLEIEGMYLSKMGSLYLTFPLKSGTGYFFYQYQYSTVSLS